MSQEGTPRHLVEDFRELRLEARTFASGEHNGGGVHETKNLLVELGLRCPAWIRTTS